MAPIKNQAFCQKVAPIFSSSTSSSPSKLEASPQPQPSSFVSHLPLLYEAESPRKSKTAESKFTSLETTSELGTRLERNITERENQGSKLELENAMSASLPDEERPGSDQDQLKSFGQETHETKRRRNGPGKAIGKSYYFCAVQFPSLRLFGRATRKTSSTFHLSASMNI